MNWIQCTLANLIRRGKITVEIPGMDEKVLARALHDEAQERLREAADILCDEDRSDKEKLDALADLLL